jgi:transaldolase
MNLYVDSAKIDEIKKSLELGYVHGITTNPTLLKKAEVWKESKNLRSFYSKILALCDGEVFVQIPSQKFKPILDELESLDMSRLIIKIPSVSGSVKIAKELVDRGYSICATAIYTPSQAIAWASLDVDYVAIYFNRMEVAGINALENTKLILNALSKSKTKVIAASVKTLEQLNSLVSVGIEYITIGYDLLEKLIESDSSQRDTKNFDEDMFNVMKNFSN